MKPRRCPHPSKVRYAAVEHARRDLARVRALPPADGEHHPVRYYRCECGFLHLTHIPLDPAFEAQNYDASVYRSNPNLVG